MKVHIPSPLRSYCHNQSQVAASGSSVAEVLSSLDANYPGIRFRMIDEQDTIRQHIKLFVNTMPVEDLSASIKDEDTLHIICALSGG